MPQKCVAPKICCGRSLGVFIYRLYNRARFGMTRFSNWFKTRSPRGQWAAGCVGVVTIVMSCLYFLGLASYLARPTLLTTPPAATIVIVIPTVQRPTFAAPTAPPTFVLPGATLPATPTQAPIPTRAPPTETPAFILDPNGTPITVTPIADETATPDATLFFQLSQTRQP